MEIAFLLGRLIFGGYFVMSGINHFTQKKNMSAYAQSKHIPSPELAVALSGAVLFVSGACIIFGWFVTISLLALIAFLFIVSFTMHNFWKVTDPQSKMSDQINFMKNMALLGACLLLLSIESWPVLL